MAAKSVKTDKTENLDDLSTELENAIGNLNAAHDANAQALLALAISNRTHDECKNRINHCNWQVKDLAKKIRHVHDQIHVPEESK